MGLPASSSLPSTRPQFSKYGTEGPELPTLARTGLVPCRSNPGVFSPGSKHVSGVSDTQSIYWNLRGTVLVSSQACILFRVSSSLQGPCLREDLCQAGAQKPLHSRKPSQKGRQAFLGLGWASYRRWMGKRFQLPPMLGQLSATGTGPKKVLG